MTAFAALHRKGAPLVLPNAWDHASAAALAAAGFPAVGTTSLGVAAALGLPDGAAATADATVELVQRLAHLRVHITADIENGFSTDPRRVAEYVGRLGPVAGVNLEDQLVEPKLHAAVLAAVTGGNIFINARIDTYWLGRPSLGETLERAKAYIAAGADGIFVPGVKDEREIAALADAIPVPLNVLFGAIPLPRLVDLGVARVSTGSLLYRVALGAATATAAAVRDGGRDFDAPSYAAVDELSIVSTSLPRT